MTGVGKEDRAYTAHEGPATFILIFVFFNVIFTLLNHIIEPYSDTYLFII